MPERPENVLTPEEIERTATAVPWKPYGSRKSTPPINPWSSWAPSVLGATILYLRDAILDLDRFTLALIENEGTGFSCTEIEEFCRVLEAAGLDSTAREVRIGHARGDDDDDDPTHKALREEQEDDDDDEA